MSKKNIDELFKERFKDFDEIPDPKVWSDIEKSLEKKKSRRIIPFWWKLGGVAATLAILLYVVNTLDKTTKDTIEVTNTEIRPTGNIETDIKIKETIKEDGYSNSESTQKNVLENNSTLHEKVTSSPSNFKESSSLEESKKSNQKSNTQKQIQGVKNTSIVQQTNLKKTNAESNIVSNSSFQKQEKQNRNLDSLLLESQVTENWPKSIEKPEKNTIHKTDLIEKSTVIVDVNKEQVLEVKKPEEKKKSILDEIVTEEVLLAENKINRWSVGPSVASVYFNGLGNGSPIDQSFTANSKSGDVNLSYGVSVAYEVNNRLQVRTGVYKVDYGYNTNEITFSPSFGANSFVANSIAQLSTINYHRNSESIVVESTVSGQNKADLALYANDISSKSAALEGSLTQQFGYVEVPLELNYTVLDKKFGINVIGGVSSLFLVDNAVLLNSGEQTTELGEANNINAVNFSTNFGFGINYKFTPKLQLNIEPLFKYQLNTFSTSSGNFQPFSVGVYSGINFRF